MRWLCSWAATSAQDTLPFLTCWQWGRWQLEAACWGPAQHGHQASRREGRSMLGGGTFQHPFTSFFSNYLGGGGQDGDEENQDVYWWGRNHCSRYCRKITSAAFSVRTKHSLLWHPPRPFSGRPWQILTAVTTKASECKFFLAPQILQRIGRASVPFLNKTPYLSLASPTITWPPPSLMTPPGLPNVGGSMTPVLMETTVRKSWVDRKLYLRIFFDFSCDYTSQDSPLRVGQAVGSLSTAWPWRNPGGSCPESRGGRRRCPQHVVTRYVKSIISSSDQFTKVVFLPFAVAFNLTQARLYSPNGRDQRAGKGGIRCLLLRYT